MIIYGNDNAFSSLKASRKEKTHKKSCVLLATVISKAIGNDNEFKVVLLAVNALSISMRRRAKFTLICFRLMYQKFAKSNAYKRHVFLLFAKSRAEPP